MNFYKTKVFITSLTLSSTAFSQLDNDLKPNNDEAKEVAEEALKPLAISPKREELLKLAAVADSKPHSRKMEPQARSAIQTTQAMSPTLPL